MKKSMLKSTSNNTNVLFLNVPNVDGPEWPESIQKMWNRDWGR